MDKRGRIPGPIQKNLSIGNLDDLVNSGVSRWQTIDVHDGSWTLNNVSSNLVASSSSSAGMRIELDQSSNGLRWNETKAETPRWYKKLQFDNGQLCTWADKFQIEFMVQLSARHTNTTIVDKNGIVVGIADTTCISATSDVEWMGVSAGINLNQTVDGVANTAGLNIKVGGDGALSGNNGTNVQRAYAIIAPNFDGTDDDGNTSTLHGMSFGFNPSLQYVSHQASGANTHEYVGTDDVYLFLAPNWIGTSSLSANADNTWKVWYRINFLENFLTPEWQLNGGQSR